MNPYDVCKRFLVGYSKKPDWKSQIRRDRDCYRLKGSHHQFEFSLGSPTKRKDSISKGFLPVISFARRLMRDRRDIALGFDYRDGYLSLFCISESEGYSIRQKIYLPEMNGLFFSDQASLVGKFLNDFDNVGIEIDNQIVLSGSCESGNAVLSLSPSRHHFYPTQIFNEGDYRMFVDDIQMSKLLKASWVENEAESLIPCLNGRVHGFDRFGQVLYKKFNGHSVSEMYRKSGYCGAFLSMTQTGEPLVFLWPDESKLSHIFLIA